MLENKISIIISVVAISISFFSWSVSRDQFLTAGRPYVIAENFGFKNEQNLLVHKPESVLIKVFNFPAKIISEEISYFSKDEKIFSSTSTDEVLIPDDMMQYEREASQEVLKNPDTTRYIRIDYRWLSNLNEKYYFESSCKFNQEKQKWQNCHSDAN